MSTAREETIKAFEEVAGLAAELARTAGELAAAIAADPPQALRIGPAMQGLVHATRHRALPLQLNVANKALGKWLLLNPGLRQEKF